MRRDVGSSRSCLAHGVSGLDGACPSSGLHSLSCLFYAFPLVDSPRKWVFSMEKSIATGAEHLEMLMRSCAMHHQHWVPGFGC